MVVEGIFNTKHIVLLYVLYGSGLRLNESLSIRVEDMWWDRNQLIVRGGKGSPRWIFKKIKESTFQVYFSATRF